MSPTLEKLLIELRRRNLKIGFAESCTGGLLSAALARNAGVSDVFWGSVVSYANEVKSGVLGVSEATLKRFGAVSVETAREMAEGARKKLKVDCAIAVTGIAGPSGGSPEKPVGTVCFCVLGPQFESHSRQQFSGDRNSIQNQSVEFALGFLLQEMLKSKA